MEIIKALSSKGSTTTDRKSGFYPDRRDLWTLQFMGSHSRIVTWTDMDGQRYKENTISLTRGSRNPIYKMIYLHGVIRQMREYHSQLMHQMYIYRRNAIEMGYIYDEEFSEELRVFMREDEQLAELVLGETLGMPSQQKNHDLITQLIGLRVLLQY